jgi:hypothetical protein
MERFNKEIIVGKETKVFEFTRMQNATEVKFFVTTKDENKKAIAFSLREKDAEWKLIPGSLRWLYSIEAQLDEAIQSSRLQ